MDRAARLPVAPQPEIRLRRVCWRGATLLAVLGAVATFWGYAGPARSASPGVRADADFAQQELGRCSKAEGGYRSASVRHGAEVKGLAKLLRGTWVRRLSFGGSLVETNSLWYFDFPDPQSGEGTALMIDRVNQGWDSHDVGISKVAGEGHESLGAATTGGFWKVRIAPQGRETAIRGAHGLKVTMSGQYRGTGSEYPPGGFEFIESGSLFRTAEGYSTILPWRAPPMAEAEGQASASGDRYTPVDALVARAGDKERRPSLTFVMCSDGIVDRYTKISDHGLPAGAASLASAWREALAAGLFDRKRPPETLPVSEHPKP